MELLGNSLGESLLTGEVRVEHTSLRGASASTRLHVLRTGRLDVAGTLVLTDLTGPDVTGRRVVVRVTPGRSTGLTPKVVGDLRVNVRGEVLTLVGVNRVGAELSDSQSGHVRGEHRVRVDVSQRDRVGRRGAEAVTDDRTVGTDRLRTRSEDVLDQEIDRVDQVPRHLVDETGSHVGEGEQVQLVGNEDRVTVLVQGDGHRGRITGRNGVRVDQLIERGDRLSEILVQREDDRGTGHSLLLRSLVRDHAEHRLLTQGELKSTVVRGLDEVRHGSGAGKGVSHVSLL